MGNNYFKKIFKLKPENLSDKFTSIFTFSISVSILFLTAYYIYSSNVLIAQNKIEKNKNDKAIANLLIESYMSDKKTGQYGNIEKTSRILIKNKLILYSALFDTKNNKYIWINLGDDETDKSSSNSLWINKLSGSNFYVVSDEIIKEFYISINKLTKLRPKDIKEITTDIDDKKLITGFYDNNALSSLLKVLLKGDLSLVLIFVIFGYFSSFLLAKYITKPLKELSLGTQEFTNGNLKYRTNIKTIDEIGQLGKAFNEMAEKLDNLYSSLEQQVKDRTGELHQANEQIKTAYKELQETQSMLIQNEKMLALGQLVAGVAHELNNPINFIYGNLEHLKNYGNDLVQIISLYEEVEKKLENIAAFENVNAFKTEVDYEFLCSDLPYLIKSCKDGSERCKQIILDLKNFSRIDEAVLKDVDIHEGIDSTLNILSNKTKNKITVHKEYGEIPIFPCYAGQLNQVFMNILDNSCQAMPDKGDIYVRTSLQNNNLVIEFEDTGEGIDEEAKSKIFDPFFTTKPVGQGTGLGLSISYKIIKKHKGTIEVESQKGKGTKFIIKMPLNWDEMPDNQS